MVDAAHIAYLVEHMRPEDRAEVFAATGLTIEQAVQQSVEVSSFSAAEVVGADVLAIWGVVEESLLTPDIGRVWMLSSTAVENHHKLFFRRSKEVVETLRVRYSALYNEVDARYTRALRWADRLGFEILPARLSGYERRPFHPIVLRGYSSWA